MISLCCHGYHFVSICVPRKLDSKKKQLERLKDQLQKLEVQATDKVYCSIRYLCTEVVKYQFVPVLCT